MSLSVGTYISVSLGVVQTALIQPGRPSSRVGKAPPVTMSTAQIVLALSPDGLQ